MFNFNKPLTDEVAFPSKPGSGQSARAQFMVLFNELKDAVNNVPGQMAGQVAHFAMATAPDGWIKADGTAVSRTVYAALFAAIGTIYGLGDGTLTFNLPDLRGKFVRSFTDGSTTDTGRVLGSNQGANSGWRTTLEDGVSGYGLNLSGSFQNRVAVSNVGLLEPRPINISLLACIKY